MSESGEIVSVLEYEPSTSHLVLKRHSSKSS